MTSFFPQNYILPECKPEWNREAITVFSRLETASHSSITTFLSATVFKILRGIFFDYYVACPDVKE